MMTMKVIGRAATAARVARLISVVAITGSMACLGGGEVVNEELVSELGGGQAHWQSRPDVQTIAELPTGFNDGVSLDFFGRLFVSNAGSFGPAGLVGTEVFRIGNAGVDVEVDGLNGPLGTVSDWFGNLYVSNFNDGTIVRRDFRGEASQFATLDGSGGGLALSRRGELFASSYSGQSVSRISRDGVVTVHSESPLLAGPVGISFGRGRMFVGNFDDGKILEIKDDGSAVLIADLGEVALGNIGYITYSRGCIFATSLNANRVFAVSLSGTVSELAGTGEFGSVDGELADAQFALPNGIAANWWGSRLYVSEFGSPNIRAIRLGRNSCPD